MSRDWQSLEKSLLRLVSQTFIKATPTKIAIVFINNTKIISKPLVQKAPIMSLLRLFFSNDQLFSNGYSIRDDIMGLYS